MDMFSVDARGTQRGIDFFCVCSGVMYDYIIRNKMEVKTVDVLEAPGEHPEGYANCIHASFGWGEAAPECDDTFVFSLRMDGNTVHYHSQVLLPGLRDAMRKAALL